MILIMSLIGFFSGAIMFSYWLARLKGINLKEIREGNPGAFNLGYAAGLTYGILGASLDFLKGYLPAYYFAKVIGLDDSRIIFLALSPILGHAFSPFLKFKGGKALATTFGVWSALTKFQISFFYAVILGILKYIERKINKNKPSLPEIDALLDLTGFGIIGIILFVLQYSFILQQFWFYNLVLLIFKRIRDIHTLLSLVFKSEQS
ncbi:glycerol-3-phosphate acyltransferase [Thermosipho atlanticus]|uniref:Acyl-phosphate glycerol 3-phosphate acyltransferase n=1 Tax=Thermosipho atlanticus DSM 15807 TaxID=1123380 RepID=A0A1M5QY37_9BACT|nr:glycerol-3-phosphate acyltransferase [Thermosipho atlanticus]SHH18463.1 acyl-phosphate glycerol 3-phosphate acyltransferase [Thermosipho atlanticus DSM 15807]